MGSVLYCCLRSYTDFSFTAMIFQVSFLVILSVNYQKIKTAKELTDYRDALEQDTTEMDNIIASRRPFNNSYATESVLSTWCSHMSVLCLPLIECRFSQSIIYIPAMFILYSEYWLLSYYTTISLTHLHSMFLTLRWFKDIWFLPSLLKPIPSYFFSMKWSLIPTKPTMKSWFYPGWSTTNLMGSIIGLSATGHLWVRGQVTGN